MLGLMVRTPIKRLLSNMCSGQWLECVPVFPQSQTVPANDFLTIACPNGCDAAKLYFFRQTPPTATRKIPIVPVPAVLLAQPKCTCTASIRSYLQLRAVYTRSRTIFLFPQNSCFHKK